MHVPHNWCAVPRKHYLSLGFYSNIPLSMDFAWFHRYFKIFGVTGFEVISQALGDYYLGGKSDEYYLQSFKWNEHILATNGTNPFVALGYRIAYSVKHAIKLRLLRRGLR